MIQRIQTVYYFLAAVLASITLFGTSIFTFSKGVEHSVTAYGFFKGTSLQEKTDFWMLTVVQLILALVVIFSYKMRHRQLFLGWILALLNVMSSIWMLMGANYYPMLGTDYESQVANLTFHTAFYIHAIAFVFTILGNFAVRKDKKIIESLDRLR